MKTILTFLLSVILFSCSTPEIPQELKQEIPNTVEKNKLIIVSDYYDEPQFSIQYNNIGAYYSYTYNRENKPTLNVNDKIIINWINKIDYHYNHTTNIRFNDKIFTIETPKGEALIFDYVIQPQDIK